MSRPSLTTIDALIAERHLLEHPFYRAWQDGTLSVDALRDYAAQYYRHVNAFPTYISALHSRCEDLETRQALLENLRDEEEGSENHPALWRRFAEAVGCNASEIGAGEIWPETASAIAGFRSAVGQGPVVRGLAALNPELASRLLPLADERMVDLHQLIHAHYYHPDFKGSFSIKDVLPVLVEGLDYSGLSISTGSQAALAFEEMTDPETPEAGRRAIREGLWAYCRRDTEAMVRLFQTLKEDS